MAKNKQKIELTEELLEQITFDAMCMSGMLPPSVEEVAALDAKLASTELPFGPSDPDELLERLDSKDNAEDTTTLAFPQPNVESVRNLARAAREGGELTTEIEQQMAADKAKFLQDENADQ